MGIDLREQLLGFAGSLLVGAAMGVLYDLLRVSRRRLRLRTVHGLLDGAFAPAALALLFLYSQLRGGQLRLYMLAGSALGLTGYLLTLSVAVRAIFTFLADALQRVLQLLGVPLGQMLCFVRKSAVKAKKLLDYHKKCYTIEKRCSAICAEYERRTAARGGHTNEKEKTGRDPAKAAASGCGNLCAGVSDHGQRPYSGGSTGQ